MEAKTKSAWTWHRGSATWQCGIDRKYFEDYLKVEVATGWPVLLVFEVTNSHPAKDTPLGTQGPTGIFSKTVFELKNRIHHGADNGMVYWTSAVLSEDA